ncbi:CNNM domain-containing protein [Planctomicrobium piriforme]|uniref:Hemolysin, contains CBS domains n=1 Tax=Planctomicrobium piriforme TaxID=1576369 RepID=A0A1I3HEF0_9PLAN|nr:CNNM domain-containing protein [Planctomicrobium piriforme]SFI34009.1 Hemolysin, contains CBS domains [Planctomicrobium piriforme]
MIRLLETTAVWLPGVLAMCLLNVASCFFSAAETAMFSLSREDLRRMQTGLPGERRVAGLMRDPDRLLTVVLFWNLIINLLYFAVSLVTARRFVSTGQPGAAAALAIIGFIGLVCFGEVAPKCLAVLMSRRIAVLSVFPVMVATRILDPALPLLGVTTAAMRRVLWPDLKLEPYLDVVDIERAVETSELGVELARLEQQMLGRILELSDMTVEEVMRPRGAYLVWQPPIQLAQLRQTVPSPELILVAGDDRDTVAKALLLKDLNTLPVKNLESLADPVVYVPWCATVADTLAALRAGLISVACVVNEYGETVGVITEDDILDTLLNPQSSRGQRLLRREPVFQSSDGRLLADGLTTLRHLAEKMDVDYDALDDDTPVTIAALLHSELERFPVVGDECQWAGLKIRVETAGEPGDDIQVSVEKLPDNSDDDET